MMKARSSNHVCSLTEDGGDDTRSLSLPLDTIFHSVEFRAFLMLYIHQSAFVCLGWNAEESDLNDFRGTVLLYV